MLRRSLALGSVAMLAAAGLVATAAPAQAKGSVAPASGTTTVTLTAAALGALGPLSPAPVAPATLGAGPTGVEAAFPITGVTRAGFITHSGGLSLTDGETSLALTSYTINTRAGKLFASAAVDGAGVGRIPLFDVELGAGTASCDAKADLTLTSAAADVLTALYGAPDLTGAPIGSACVDLT